jgi:malonyl-CoA decarboxylase
VVEELRADLPGLRDFATLSPAPGFRAWLERRLAAGQGAGEAGEDAEKGLAAILARDGWCDVPALVEEARPSLLRLCARYLTASPRAADGPIDPVARFHLGNGARLERINWMANPQRRGLQESWGIMVNYLYQPTMIEANHEAFARQGEVVRSAAVDALLPPPPAKSRPSRRRPPKALRRARHLQQPA